MPTNGIRTLDEVILEQEFPFIHFFNGRILSGEDLSREQLANREARRRLARSIGSGVVQGLEVSLLAPQTDDQKPKLRVRKGLAISRGGDLLNLRDDTSLSLVRTTETTPLSRDVKFFEQCAPVQTGLYIAGAGLYLLTVGPAVGSQGRAPVTGLQNNEVGCNSRYTVEGVRFRLAEIPKNLFTEEELDDEAHLRNLVAYKCFGAGGDSPFQQMPFRLEPNKNPSGQADLRYGIIDEMRARKVLSDCEVPLAVVYWTADGLKYIDMWSVRRRIIKLSANGDWDYTIGDRRRAEAEAMVLQFQEQVSQEHITLAGTVASDRFRYLPPVGIVPIGGSGNLQGHTYLKFIEGTKSTVKFFSGMIYRNSIFIEGGRVHALISEALSYPPVHLSGKDRLHVWMYVVRENKQTIDISEAGNETTYAIFVSGHVPFFGAPRFDVSRWNYSNYTSAVFGAGGA